MCVCVYVRENKKKYKPQCVIFSTGAVTEDCYYHLDCEAIRHRFSSSIHFLEMKIQSFLFKRRRKRREKGFNSEPFKLPLWLEEDDAKMSLISTSTDKWNILHSKYYYPSFLIFLFIFFFVTRNLSFQLHGLRVCKNEVHLDVICNTDASRCL